jgi:hypothetical protein
MKTRAPEWLRHFALPAKCCDLAISRRSRWRGTVTDTPGTVAAG